MKEFIPKMLPLKKDFETKSVLKKAIKANIALAKLNGVAKIIPNSKILINSLILQEAKDSSEIENIVTTHDELYKATLNIEKISKEVKEVQNYREALLKGYFSVKENRILIKRYILDIQKELEKNNAGIRKQSGTQLKNLKTGEIVLTPPQNYQKIEELFSNLEKYINEENNIDPLINIAIIHYQFEMIHPFYDGNGRTGRIINVLYLVLKDLLDIPILYLSSYIIKNKKNYYKLLQNVRINDNWEEWILYILDGIEEVSLKTIKLINNIKNIMDDTKSIMKKEIPKIYSKDLLDVIFKNPYTKIDFLIEELNIHRTTASTYLNELEKIEILKSIKIGRAKYFVNIELYKILKQGI